MLSKWNMDFSGRQHSGLDDTRNIATVALNLMSEGCLFYSTSTEGKSWKLINCTVNRIQERNQWLDLPFKSNPQTSFPIDTSCQIHNHYAQMTTICFNVSLVSNDL